MSSSNSKTEILEGYKAVTAPSEEDKKSQRSLYAQFEAVADLKFTYDLSELWKSEAEWRSTNPSLRVAYIDEVEEREGGGKVQKVYYSVLVKALDNLDQELPSLSILDFAVIPLKKPRRPRVDEKNQDEGRRTFNLFTNKNLSCNRVETRFSPEEEEKISWQLQLLGHPKNIHLLNVWRSQDPNLGDYATWPLEMSFEGIPKLEETPTMSGKGLPIVLKLDNEHEQTERDWIGKAMKSS
ncbi:hypothetical protein U1Q18_048706 [Sarracenia purpurea var. burkii]